MKIRQRKQQVYRALGKFLRRQKIKLHLRHLLKYGRRVKLSKRMDVILDSDGKVAMKIWRPKRNAPAPKPVPTANFSFWKSLGDNVTIRFLDPLPLHVFTVAPETVDVFVPPNIDCPFCAAEKKAHESHS